MSNKTALFAIYSKPDETLYRELRTHLAPLRRQGVIELTENLAGETPKESLHKHDVLLLLISGSLLDDDNRYDLVEEALRLRGQGKRVVPVLLRPTVLKGLTLEQLVAVPRNGNPITEWVSRDAGWVEVVQEIHKFLAGPANAPPGVALEEIVHVPNQQPVAGSKKTL